MTRQKNAKRCFPFLTFSVTLIPPGGEVCGEGEGGERARKEGSRDGGQERAGGGGFKLSFLLLLTQVVKFVLL